MQKVQHQGFTIKGSQGGDLAREKSLLETGQREPGGVYSTILGVMVGVSLEQCYSNREAANPK